MGDRDGDGVPDGKDNCPDHPEDKDGFQDADGCPDPDNDKDNIPDKVDKCPNQRETYNGFMDKDGCPDPAPRCVFITIFPISDKIYFDANGARISKIQWPIVAAMARRMRAAPWVVRIELRGHADPAERDAARLSLARARALQKALRARGVSTELVARGLGASDPFKRGRDPASRAANRRVELAVTRRRPRPQTRGCPPGWQRAPKK